VFGRGWTCKDSRCYAWVRLPRAGLGDADGQRYRNGHGPVSTIPPCAHGRETQTAETKCHPSERLTIVYLEYFDGSLKHCCFLADDWVGEQR
jgi:hypothetical protein